ncbi:MAG: undecaprenyl/decaprenyl-phosphate alpha-N-acetylglucosaminyl 1-phosphate transferase [Acidimicrobiia bacterium]|nr:undecaprenyl/decaprenyl-phosphate alpha-N-acetylglucosaminyl 1-phosphate transferase [Acidimicrobiia bacterium]
MPALTAYAIVFAIAGLVTVAVTPLVRLVAEREGAVAEPDERKVHLEPTATIGGAAMLVGFLVAVGVAALMDEFDPVFASGTEMLGVVVAALVIFGVGLVDDLREISAPAKTAGMVLAGSILSFAGVGLLVFRVPFLDLFLLSPDWSALATVVWVLLMANAINFIDGLDGLAAGIVAIAAGTFFLYAIRLGDADVLLASNPGALIAAITLGVCVGFLPHNFHPARIFMGDGGALLLGLLMAASTMAVGGRTSEPFSGQAFFFFAPIFIPLIILAVPIIDTAFAVVRRASRRRSPVSADKEHLHHRLMRLGHGHRRSVLIMWAWTMLLCGFVLYPTYTGSGDGIVPFGIGGLMLLLYTVFHPGLRGERWSDLFRSSRGGSDTESPPG